MLQENGKIVIDDKLVANIFNDYFCSIASQIGLERAYSHVWLSPKFDTE